MSIYYQGKCGHSIDGSECQICDRERAFKMQEILTECLVYLYLENPDDKKCNSCEPENLYKAKYICVVHKLIMKIENVLKNE